MSCIICFQICINTYKIRCEICNTRICKKCCTYELYNQWRSMLTSVVITDKITYDTYTFSIECSYMCAIQYYITIHNHMNCFYEKVIHKQDELINKYRNDTIMPMLNFHLIKDLSKIIVEYE